ncbi:MAG: hypothetical protein LBG44_01310 [Gemmatimonadota bacterium]|jgi:hypothetical protein|nr:hypothetical protein [Gemmatimonadota bacterium]
MARNFDRNQHDRRKSPRPARVTAAFNADYLEAPREEYIRNPNPFGGSRPDQMIGEDEYQERYITHGGTDTSRGEPCPPSPDDQQYASGDAEEENL